MKDLGLKGIERQSWRMLQRDGLMDALFGVIFLAAAVIAVLDRTNVSEGFRIAVLAVIQLSGAAALIWIRKRCVVPRLGRVKYAAARVRSSRTLRILLAVCVLFTVFLVILTALSNRLGFRFIGDVSGLGVWLIISGVIFVPIAGMALFLEYPRLLIYAGLLSAVEFLHVVVRLPERMPYASAYTYGAASIVAFAVGVPIFVRFLQRTPRPALEPEEGDRGN
jgi:hypothetical protein